MAIKEKNIQEVEIFGRVPGIHGKIEEISLFQQEIVHGNPMGLGQRNKLHGTQVISIFHLMLGSWTHAYIFHITGIGSTLSRRYHIPD
jgi:hypothetical protein